MITINRDFLIVTGLVVYALVFLVLWTLSIFEKMEEKNELDNRLNKLEQRIEGIDNRIDVKHK